MSTQSDPERLSKKRGSSQDDMRLATFHAFLMEECDMSTCVMLLRARGMLTQQPPFACIQYPEPAKGEGGPWVCQAKAAWISDACLEGRPQAIRDRFLEFLHLNAVQVGCLQAPAPGSFFALPAAGERGRGTKEVLMGASHTGTPLVHRSFSNWNGPRNTPL